MFTLRTEAAGRLLEGRSRPPVCEHRPKRFAKLRFIPVGDASSHLKVQRKFRHDKLIEAHAFRFCFARQGGVQ